jgi:hypothetical protein
LQERCKTRAGRAGQRSPVKAISPPVIAAQSDRVPAPPAPRRAGGDHRAGATVAEIDNGLHYYEELALRAGAMVVTQMMIAPGPDQGGGQPADEDAGPSSVALQAEA